MKKSIKIICLLCVLAIACSLIFSACEDKSTTEKTNEKESSIEKNDLQKIINLLEVSSEKTIFNWQSKTVFVKISLK